MNLIRCRNGHFYDADRYRLCPLCSMPGEGLRDEIPQRFRNLGQIRLLGRGATSRVYRIDGAEPLALKVIDCGRDEEKFRSAGYEKNIMAWVGDCSRAVKLVDFEEETADDGSRRVFLLEKYYQPLEERLKHGSMSLGEVLDLVMGLCEAVQQLAERQVLHLDLKPKNLYLDPDEGVKLGDFGSALLFSDVPGDQRLRGTLEYMAPEVYQDRSCSEQSEVYSIGLILYTLLNDQRLPFQNRKDERELAVYKRLAGAPLPDFYLPVGDAVKVALFDLIRRACAYRTRDRAKNAGELKERLAELAGKLTEREKMQPVVVHRPFPGENAWGGTSGWYPDSLGDTLQEDTDYRLATSAVNRDWEQAAPPREDLDSGFSAADSALGDTVNPEDSDADDFGSDVWASPCGHADPEEDGSAFPPPAPPRPSFAPAALRPAYESGEESSVVPPPPPRRAYAREEEAREAPAMRYAYESREETSVAPPPRRESTADFAPRAAAERSAAPSAPAPRRVAVKKAAPKITQVEFSVVAPKRLTRGEYAVIDFVMYEEAYRHVVDEIHRQAEEPLQEKRSGTIGVAAAAKIRVVLSSPDFEIEDGEQEGVWEKSYLEFSFPVMLPEDYAKKQVLFQARVYVNGMIASRLSFVAKCFSFTEQKPLVERRDVSTVFVSYASQDRKRVASIVQGMQMARPDLDVFFDVEGLRGGDDWERVLYREIEKRDVLYLCWSRSAKASPWVEREWRYALSRKGVDGIEPLPIEPPEACPPPAELNSKYWSDKLLYLIEYTPPEQG